MHTTAVKPALPITQYIVVPDVLLVCLVALHPPLFIRILGFATLLYLGFQSLYFTLGDPTQDYFLGFYLSAQVLLAVQFLFIKVPIDELRHERDLKSRARDFPLWYRLYWAFCLDHSVRAIGWTHEINRHPARIKTSRGNFIRSRTLLALINIGIADIANTYILFSQNAEYSPGTPVLQLIFRCTTITAWVGMTYAMANVQYYVPAVICVGIGYSRTEDWPDVFDSFVDAYTLRRFWGRVWHQNLRRLFTPLSSTMIKLLRVKRGTNTSSYIQLYTSFILSGLIHCAADAMVDWRLTGTSMPFFINQALAITVEDAVISLCERTGIVKGTPMWAKMIGYLWVFAWGVHSFSAYRDLAVEAGWGWSVEWPYSFASFVQGLLVGTQK